MVVRCLDPHPTAPRDDVHRDSAYHALRGSLAGTSIAGLLDLASRDQPLFLRLCDSHRHALKGSAVQHEDFGAAVLDSLPFTT